ncbi:Uncharacterised protein [Pseudomonas aeruginosa]|nr:Uncharacterised protein [Pseudomonas aeruginosa]
MFLGGATVNDEPQVAFSGLVAHGAPAESDVVALLRPHAGGFLLLFPERRGGYESSSSAAEPQALSSS